MHVPVKIAPATSPDGDVIHQSLDFTDRATDLLGVWASDSILRATRDPVE
jgi:hypothetical protein